MKKQFLYTLVLLFFSIGLLQAQILSGTHTIDNCTECLPPGWIGLYGTNKGHNVSNNLVYGKPIHPSANEWYYFTFVPALPAPPSGHANFMSIDNNVNNLSPATSATMIKGLVRGHYYKIKYNISAAKVKYNFQYFGNGNYTMDLSDYAKWAEVKVNPSKKPGVQIDQHSEKFEFIPGVNTDKWLAGSMTFIADSDSAEFRIYGQGTNNKPGVVNLDVVGIEPLCSINNSINNGQNSADVQISMSITSVNPCFGSTLDLTDTEYLNVIPRGTVKDPLPGFEVRIFDNPNHTGNQVKTTTKNGKYYYFFYDSVAGCYNTNNSNAVLTVTFQTEQQVLLNQSQIVNKCAGTTADLNSVYFSAYPVVWYKNPEHLGAQISNPEAVGAGTYYAFFKDPVKGCFFTNNSLSKVVVSIPDQLQVPLKGDLITSWCPSAISNLNLMPKNAVPLGLSLQWFTNADHSGIPVTDPTAVAPGTYYAFYYDTVNKCYKTIHSTSKVSVVSLPEFQVPLSASTAVNSCPSKVIDLTKLVKGSAPSGYKVVWYTNNTHSGTAITDPAAVTKVGTYYAFYFNESNSCFGAEISTAKVDAKIGRCEFVANPITLNTKVFLQGAMDGAAMHNTLQTYDGTGLLPVLDPYTGTTNYPDIAKVYADAGEVVDWVRVEIRSSLDPAIILEAQSCLLRTDGKIVNTEGNEPTFQSQALPVHLVVKHRNHLPVMSTALNFAGASASYDFTTALSQAFKKEIDDPAQMIQVNGVWCMWAGDVNEVSDMGIDATDYNIIFFSNDKTPFDVYIKEDLNMDGGVDATDLNILFFNNDNFSLYSTLLNYIN